MSFALSQKGHTCGFLYCNSAIATEPKNVNILNALTEELHRIDSNEALGMNKWKNRVTIRRFESSHSKADHFISAISFLKKHKIDAFEFDIKGVCVRAVKIKMDALTWIQ